MNSPDEALLDDIINDWNELTTPRLVVSAIITPDGTRIESAHRHDYNSHTDSNGEYYFIDGGLEYLRTSMNLIPAIHDSVMTNDHHEVIRLSFKWGTYGKNGKGPYTRKLLCDLDTDHIEQIIETQHQESRHISCIFSDELLFRQVKENLQ